MFQPLSLRGGAFFGVDHSLAGFKNKRIKEARDEDLLANLKVRNKYFAQVAAFGNSVVEPGLKLQVMVSDVSQKINAFLNTVNDAQSTMDSDQNILRPNKLDLSPLSIAWNALVSAVNPYLTGPNQSMLDDNDANQLKQMISNQLMTPLQKLRVDIASKAAALPPVSVPSVVINQDVLFGNEQESILNQIEAGWYLPVKYGPQRSGINMAIAGPGASSQLPPPGSAAQPPGGQPQNPALPAGQPPNPALPAGQPPAPVPAGQQGLSSQDQQTLSIYVSAEINKMKQRAVKYVKDEILKLADRANYSRAEKKQLSQWFTQNDLQYIENPLDKNIFDTFRTQVQDPNFTARFQSLADAQQAFDNALQQLSLNNYLQQMINDIVHELETNVFPTSPMTPQQPQTQSAASAASAAQTAAAAQPASPSSTLTSTITSGLTGFKNLVSSGLQNIRGKVSGGPANPPSQQRQPSPPPATPMSPTAARPLINPQLSPTSQLAVAQKKGADIEYYWDPSTNTFVGEDKLLAMTDQARGQAIKSDKFRMKIDEIKPIIKKYAQNETFKGANLEALKVKLIKAMNSQQKSPGAAATAATGKGRKGKTDYSGPMEEPQTPRPKRSVGSAPRPRPRSSRGLPDESFEGFDDSANDLFMKPQPMQPKTELMMIENAHVPIMSGNKGLPKIYGMENKLKNMGYYKPKF